MATDLERAAEFCKKAKEWPQVRSLVGSGQMRLYHYEDKGWALQILPESSRGLRIFPYDGFTAWILEGWLEGRLITADWLVIWTLGAVTSQLRLERTRRHSCDEKSFYTYTGSDKLKVLLDAAEAVLEGKGGG